jgi:hypothetical protein
MKYSYADDDDIESDEESVKIERAPRIGDFDDINQIDPEVQERIRRKKMVEEMQRRDDEEYANEWGYGLIKSLRGKSVGRRLRRKLFKFGIIQLFCGIPLATLAYLESRNFPYTEQFDSAKYGSTLIVSILSMIFFSLFNFIVTLSVYVFSTYCF